jgi:hypothetical protein
MASADSKATTGSIFWTSGTTVWSVASDGSNRHQVVLLTGALGGFINDVVVSGNALFWDDGRAIGRVALGGGSSRILVRSTGIGHLQVSAGRLYWSQGAKPTIQSSDLNGGGRRTVVKTNQLGSLSGLRVAGTQLYWISDTLTGNTTTQTLMAAQIDGSGTRALFDIDSVGSQAQMLRIANGYVYWVVKNAVLRAKFDGSGRTTVGRSPRGYSMNALGFSIAPGYIVWTIYRPLGNPNISKIIRASSDGSGAHVVVTVTGNSGMVGVGAVTAT